MRTRIRHGVGRLFALWLMAASCAAAATDGTRRSSFSAETYAEHVKFLADDKLEGRRPGTPGIEQAAEYIAAQFKAAGLAPAGDDGTYFQRFEVTRGKKLTEKDARLECEGLDGTWQIQKDWVPLPYTDTADVKAPLAFAGYGIEAELHEYNDYRDFDAKDKALLVFRYEPQSDDPGADFGGRELSDYASFRKKALTAARHGAVALLIVNPPVRTPEDKLFTFDEELTHQTYALPMIQVRREVAEALLVQAGLPNLTALEEKLGRERKPLSTDMRMMLTLKTGVEPNKLPTRNVIGLLRGNGQTDETIVVGAHYDHLGKVRKQFDLGDPNSVIHNGADDNASGTAGVIELARILAAENGLRRNVVFIAFSGEEMGLLGSKYFCAHPTVRLTGVKAMINFDMIGRLSANKFTVFGTPTGKELADLVKNAAEQAELKYRDAQGVASNSDHDPFYQQGIPFLFPFTGVHKQYHRPEDDADLIDADGATRILDMFGQIVRELANMSDGPTFEKPTAEPEPEDEQMKPAIEHQKDADKAAESTGKKKSGHGGETATPSMPGVRLGIVPDYAGQTTDGVLVDTVIDGGAAKAAGIEDGDRIIKIGPDPIKDIYGYMDVLKGFKPGDEVVVVVVRKDKEIALKVKLKGASRPKTGQD